MHMLKYCELLLKKVDGEFFFFAFVFLCFFIQICNFEHILHISYTLDN